MTELRAKLKAVYKISRMKLKMCSAGKMRATTMPKKQEAMKAYLGILEFLADSDCSLNSFNSFFGRSLMDFIIRRPILSE